MNRQKYCIFLKRFKFLIIAFSYIIIFGTASDFVYSSSHSNIKKIQNISQFFNEVQKAEQDTLVVFDIDDVIFTAKDEILKPYNKEYNNELAHEIQNRIPKKEAEKLWGIILETSHYKVVDPSIIKIIKDLQSKNIKVLGLTNIITGSLGNIASIEDWDLNKLKKYDINFERSWTDIREIKFKNITHIKETERFPIFKQGVLFTSGASKGEVLKIFLMEIEMKPKKVIFIDDKLRNIEDVQRFATSEGIEFSGYEYTAVRDLEKKSLNEERARCQFEYLEKQHKWLSDEEADALISKDYCKEEKKEISR